MLAVSGMPDPSMRKRVTSVRHGQYRRQIQQILVSRLDVLRCFVQRAALMIILAHEKVRDRRQANGNRFCWPSEMHCRSIRFPWLSSISSG